MDPAGAISGSGAASQLAKSPTLTMGATVQGMILGTAAYMAPEQAKGLSVDKRVDIWAFGVVLYEMLCGGSLFGGDTVGDTLAAVIRAEIDLDRLPASTPAAKGQTRGATWSRDGYIYFTQDTVGGLLRVQEQGGPVTPVTELDTARDERTHRWPQALPDGSAVLFTCDTQASTEYYDDARIEAVRPATGERKVLVEGSSQGRYAPGGHLVFARGGSLYAVDFDEKSLTVHGTPILVAQGVATDVGSGAVQFAIAASGAAVWAPGGSRASYRSRASARPGSCSAARSPRTRPRSHRTTVFVRPFPDGDGRWQISTASGLEARWSPDGGSSSIGRIRRSTGCRSIPTTASRPAGPSRCSTASRLVLGFIPTPSPPTASGSSPPARPKDAARCARSISISASPAGSTSRHESGSGARMTCGRGAG